MDAWVREDYQNSCTTDVDKHKEPPLLRAENRKKLHIWMVDRLQIDTRRRTYRLIFECQAERSRKITAIRMMQSLWRRALIRALIPGWLDHCYLKIRANYDDPDSHYYIDRRTGESFWEKPKLLRGNELPTQPVYIWVDIGYYDHQGYYYEQYVNPITGQFSHLSIDAAARVIQNLVRSFQIRPFVIHLNKIDKSLLEASYDLGNSKFETFWRVTFPLSLPGVIGAILIIFIPTVGDYVTPQLVGGTDGRMLSNMIQSLFGRANNFPLGAASAILMLTTVCIIAAVVTYITKKVSMRMS